MSSTRISVLRHGLPEGENCFRGITDFAITSKGLEQMHKATRSITAVDVVISSPLIRCAHFANEFATHNQIPLIKDTHWMEINFGDWDGREKEEVWIKEESALSQFWSTPWQFTPPNGETLAAYDQRVAKAWKQLLVQHQGKHVLLVTHGGVMKQLFRQIMQMPKSENYLHRLNIPYAGLMSLSVYHDDNGKDWPELQWPNSQYEI